jgi:hypothetical protein
VGNDAFCMMTFNLFSIHFEQNQVYYVLSLFHSGSPLRVGCVDSSGAAPGYILPGFAKPAESALLPAFPSYRRFPYAAFRHAILHPTRPVVNRRALRER